MDPLPLELAPPVPSSGTYFITVDHTPLVLIVISSSVSIVRNRTPTLIKREDDTRS
jgi:hypothetical protein